MPTTIAEKTKKKETSKTKNPELLLDSLEIKGYRCFEHLTIEKLSRVNLIVGKNNVGKTALLEALWIYAKRGRIEALLNILEYRDELITSLDGIDNLINPKITREIKGSIANLFYGRPKLSPERNFLVEIKNIRENEEKQKEVWFTVHWGIEEDNSLQFNTESARRYGSPYLDSTVFQWEEPEETELISLENMRRPFSDSYSKLSESLIIASSFIQLKGLEKIELQKLWDSISLTNFEDDVVESLKILFPSIQKLAFIGNYEGVQTRIPVTRIKGIDNPIPLRSLGEGINRLLGIVLSLVNCKNGILLIDEVESGLHYSVLPDVWRLIFKTAKDLNVQVFATTHSYDCIQAFAEAAIEDEESEGNLIRLARNEDQIKAFTFDEKQLATITKEHIEVR